GYQAYLRVFPNPVVHTVGRSTPKDWPYIHPAIKDKWAGGRAHTFAIRFAGGADEARPLFLILGLCGGSPSERSKVVVTVNGADLPAQVAPSGDPHVCFNPADYGRAETMVFEVPPGRIRKGENAIAIRLDEQSWILYDYVALSAERKPLQLAAPDVPDLVAELRKGPMAGVEEIGFAARAIGDDPHWYANFGPTLPQARWRTYGHGGKLCRLNLATGKATVLLDDPKGGVRDPCVHYDGRTILFSYRKGDDEHYHLYTIHADGTGLRQLTDGPFDDVEAIWLPDGDIMFLSTRCNRCVNCHITLTAILYRCRPDGSDIRMLSSNNEHDNTPWVMPNGQVVYTRWEYVDRNQVSFHHLWAMNPDGTRQTVFFGNQVPGITMIDAKPIPGSHKVVASFSPGHGIIEHAGVVTVVDPRCGPDDMARARRISRTADWRDPWAFSEEAFLAARGPHLFLLDGKGRAQGIYKLPDADIQRGLTCHEPRPLVPRPREPVAATPTNWAEGTGRLLLLDAHHGRNMAGVKPGEIKKLLVLETLPKPINYTGGMEPMSYGGTFTLERILGTVPVEADGSAYAELPALRSLFFVALDERELSVKRMQSFLTVMPGETTACIGCHEQRTAAPQVAASIRLGGSLTPLPAREGEGGGSSPSKGPTLSLPSPWKGEGYMALRRPPSHIEPFVGIPDVLDFPRDVQPILDRHCVRCHDEGRRDGGVSLSGDRGPIFSISYYALTARGLISDGRNGPGNRPPRSIGSSASRLVKLLDGSHYDAKPSEHERRMVRLWIDSGAAYPGTYAALGTGMVGGFEIVDRSIRLDRSDADWPSMKAAADALGRRCGACHDERKPLPLSPSHIVGPGAWGSAFRGHGPWIDLTPNDIRRRWSRHLFYNLSRPGKSLLLLAPLAKAAGGLEACGKAIFADKADADYQKVLLAISEAKRKLDEIKRFDMPGFRPRAEYVAYMQRYGILPTALAHDTPVDPYATDQAYWRSLWHAPAALPGP
ncbi:MAG: hypothetical protein FJ290_16675, partial [Planctomycetes bacterium]|nr:hypothetical protein [Planctomycetota bacterium]